MNKFLLRVLDYKKPILWILVIAVVIIISIIGLGRNPKPDDDLNNAGYEKISLYLKEECINAFSLYYVLTDFIISDYSVEVVGENIEAIFSYTVIYKNHDRDPDTVQYIREAKERGDKNYQKYYDEYLQPQEMNFYFKAVIDENDEITLFSKNLENESQWEETEMSDFVIVKITKRHESEKRELYETSENNIAKYISYDYYDRSMYIYGLKIFEEFGTEKFGYINEGGASITTNESLNENVLEFFISVSTGSLPATGSIVGPDVRFKMDLDTNEIVEKEFTPAPNYAEVAERIPELINPDSIQYSKKMIELSDERLIEIGLYFKEFINEIEESRGYYEKSLVSPNNDNISSQGDPDISLSEESLSDEESLSNEDVSVLIKQADVLAEHITEYSAYMFKIPKDGSLITELSDVEIFRHIASTFIFADIENHPYNDIAKASVAEAENSGNAIYTLDSTQKMAYQLFGKENFLGNFENSYDESTKTYIIPTGAGFGNNLMVENVVSIQNGDTIETQVKLIEGPIGENYLEEFGTFKMVFEIINEGNDVFLRFKEMSLI